MAMKPGCIFRLVLVAATLGLLYIAAAQARPAIPPAVGDALRAITEHSRPWPVLPPEVAAAVRKRAAEERRKPPQGDALGPQHSPSLPSSKLTPVPAAPAPSWRARPVGSQGDWAGRRRQEQAGRVGRTNSTAGAVCPDVRGGMEPIGRCPDVCDQLADTCPFPSDLPIGKTPPRGGPVGSDPPTRPLFTMTPADVQTAVAKGTLRMTATAATQHAGVTLDAVQAAAFASSPTQTRASASGNSTTRAASAEQGALINSGDSWAIRNSNCEIAPIHGILNRYNKFIMIDRIFYTETGQTPNPYGITASEYDVTTNTFRDLSSGITSNSWCSAGGGQFGGSVIDLGGGGNEPVVPDPTGGGDSIRIFNSCNDGTCQIVENDADPTLRLLAYRWYPTAVLNWDGRLLIASGVDYDENTGNHGDTYEIWPRRAGQDTLSQYKLPIDLDTQACVTGGVTYGPRPLYPHMHLLPTYEYFVASCNQWWVGYMLGPNQNYLNKGPGYLDPRWDDGGTPVTYPGSGTSFLLPLYPPYSSATVVLCGATWGYNRLNSWVDPDCAVITPTDANPVSSRAGGVTMINKRIMPYCINLLDGNVACMMGAVSGFAGYYSATTPQLQVDLLNTTTMRFSAGATATVPRLYHSVASLVATGAVITAGSNPQGSYYFSSDPATGVFPAELRVEYYYPWYFNIPRPALRSVTGANSANTYPHGSTITVTAQLTALTNTQSVAVIMPGFSTHNLQMSQRYVVLACSCGKPVATMISTNVYVPVGTCPCTIPESYAVTPAGDYLITLLDGGVPSVAQWISIGP